MKTYWRRRISPRLFHRCYFYETFPSTHICRSRHVIPLLIPELSVWCYYFFSEVTQCRSLNTLRRLIQKRNNQWKSFPLVLWNLSTHWLKLKLNKEYDDIIYLNMNKDMILILMKFEYFKKIVFLTFKKFSITVCISFL